jgi:hypothetical protein
MEPQSFGNQPCLKQFVMLAIVKENILCFIPTGEQFSLILALLTLHANLLLLCKHTYEVELLRPLVESFER